MDELEPTQTNIRGWLDSIYTKAHPIENSRWQQSNIDTLFYAGAQDFVNQHFNFAPTSSYQKYYFNLIQQPVNMLTGYQRQHRKSLNYVPHEGADPNTTDQYTRMITNVFNTGGLHNVMSKSFELSAVAGMNLVQPYLDFTGDDPAQGEMKLKLWEYNSFMVDPYFRNPDMSDAQFVWCQEYISKFEAELRFPDKIKDIRPMSGAPQRYGNFYFLPENYNMASNKLMVLSYVWYKSKRKKKRLYSAKRNQFFDFSESAGNLDQILYAIDDFKVVNVDVTTWKVAVVLNDTLMFHGVNPLGFDSCPFTPVFWNYDPHINYYDLRVRSLVRTMRDPQFLYNYKVITNNDITAATINAGWKRKVGAVANEDNLKKSGQGWDVIINEGYELTDCEKIIPSGVPESDMALAQQMADLIYTTSGINLENWAGQDDKQISSLTAMIKMAANLMVFQKYFDQWDHAFKLVGDNCLKIALNNWNDKKVSLLIGEEPTPHFYSRIFAKYQISVEEGLLTPTQKNFQAQQLLDINAQFGREVFPPSMIIKDMNLQGKAEAIEFLQKQEEQMNAIQTEQANVQAMFEDAKIKELYSKATANIARAREDHSRSESNLGLYEERLSMIERNRAMSIKEKQEALSKLLENINRYGEIETMMMQEDLNEQSRQLAVSEEGEKQDVERRTGANKFLAEIMGQQPSPEQQQQQQPQMPMM
jgi:hypothetical protein